MEKKIIVTGSSGFIGSYLIKELLKEGHLVIGIDLIKSEIIHPNFKSLIIDLKNESELSAVALDDTYCVCHLAAKIRVDESMIHPDIYYSDNVLGTINLLNWCKKMGVSRILFASTAAVYGNYKSSDEGYLEEEAGNPLSIYGKTKLMCEQIIKDYGFSGYIFRFFNVCGGSELNHGTPIHLIPLVVNNILNRKNIKIYGSDYKTKDGTCIRDYIHLKDISRAFIMAMKSEISSELKTYNLGSEEGFSVKEIINKIFDTIYKMIPNLHKVSVEMMDRRPGDFDILLANSELIRKELGWKTTCDLNKMITDTIESFIEFID